jgi:hypothetical protein
MVLRLLVGLLYLFFFICWFLLGFDFWWVAVTFRSIPDGPIRHLDLILPEAKTSILAASSGLCTKAAADDDDRDRRSRRRSAETHRQGRRQRLQKAQDAAPREAASQVVAPRREEVVRAIERPVSSSA